MLVMARKTTVQMPAVKRLLEELGENIRLARLRRRLPAQLLAERAGMSRTTLRAVENGEAGVTIGAYANAFRPDPPTNYAANETINEARDDLTPGRYADIVDDWIADGATIVGGCCDITPAHIAEIHTRLDRADAPAVSGG